MGKNLQPSSSGPRALELLYGVGPVRSRQLMKLGLNNLMTLAGASDEWLNEIAGDAQGKDFLRASLKRLKGWREEARKLVDWKGETDG